MLQRSRLLPLAALTSVLLMQCGGSSGLEDYQAGRSSAYLPGVPVFDMEAIPSVPGEASGVQIYISVPSSSLTFEKWGSQFWAIQEMRVAVYRLDPEEEERSFVFDQSWTDTTAVSDYSSTQRHDPFLFRRRVDVPPGDYDIEVTVQNLSSQQSEMRHQLVKIHDPSDRGPFLGRVLVRARSAAGTYLPVVPYVIPSGLDSLECVVRAYQLRRTRPSAAMFDLVRYRTDTVAALPPSSITAFDLPLGYGTFDFSEPETVFVGSRSIGGRDGADSIILPLRGLPPGNYKSSFQVQTASESPASGDTMLYADRFIAMGGPTFPRPSTLAELIESMVYIARREEMVLLREAPTPEIAHARFDSLWLSFRKDPAAAASLIEKYYSRVEEANRLFTTTKEGWRTDRGMVFIVLGPPIEIMNSRDRQIWYYDLGGGDAMNVYTFQRRFVRNDRVTLQTYTLFRQPYYEIFWDRMVEKWRRGEVF